MPRSLDIILGLGKLAFAEVDPAEGVPYGLDEARVGLGGRNIPVESNGLAPFLELVERGACGGLSEGQGLRDWRRGLGYVVGNLIEQQRILAVMDQGLQCVKGRGRLGGLQLGGADRQMEA